MSKRTPGKLKKTYNTGIWQAVTDANGSSCHEALIDERGNVVALVVAHTKSHRGNPDTEANARRLMAAWNACEGLPTDDLEACPEGGMFHLADHANKLAIERDSLHAINAELIAELQRIADANPRTWDAETRDQFMPWAQNRARAAISSAQKQTEKT